MMEQTAPNINTVTILLVTMSINIYRHLHTQMANLGKIPQSGLRPSPIYP